MKIELLKTEGEYLLAEVRVNGEVLGVMDEFSPITAEQWQHGTFGFGALVAEDDGDASWWKATFEGNPERWKRLVRIGDWSYDGYGRVVAIHPVRVDFGLLTLDVGDWTNDTRCIGEYVFVRIDRLDLTVRSPWSAHG